MSWPITDDDIGLKVLREAPAEAEAAQITDIVAIHGLGAHPDRNWCKDAGTKESPQWVNWLKEENMLPKVAPNARIMRYGYQSQWFGKEAMQQSASTVAKRLLLALKRKRDDILSRPLLFVAHCFGGLVVLKALVEAEQYPGEWPGVFSSTTGLIFFGTPFRGAGGMDQMEMLEAARREYDKDQVQPTALEVLQPGNVYLQDLVDSFLKKLRGQTNKMQIACFYELMSSNVGRIVGKQDRTRVVVSKSSGCLDPSDTTKSYPLSRTHFNMNKFGKNTEEDFEIVIDVVKTMINTSMPRSFIQQSTLGTKRHFPQPIQVRHNKRVRLGHQSNDYRNMCYGCHKIGHWRRHCPDRLKDTCYTCEKKGHWSEDCPETPYAYGDRDEELDGNEVDDDEDVDDDSESEDEFGEGWTGVFG